MTKTRKYHYRYQRHGKRFTILFTAFWILALPLVMYDVWTHKQVSPVQASAPMEHTHIQVVTVDPLYTEIAGDPIKKAIYDQFVQVSPKVAREALEIVKQESNYNPLAKNPAGTASGLFQVIASTWKGYHCQGDVFNAEDNIRCGFKIYQHSHSWREWATAPIYLE